MAIPFLQRLQSTLSDYFRPEQSENVPSEVQAFVPSAPRTPSIANTIRGIMRSKPEMMSPIPEAERNAPYERQTPMPTPGVSPQQIQQGYQRFSQTPPPIAEYAELLAQAGQGLPDPLLPAVMPLMETGGGNRMVANNNYYNVRGQQNGETKFIDYPDAQTAILGGNGSQGFKGLIGENPRYQEYRDSGDLADFFQRYTPPGAEYGNPTMEELLARYAALRLLFTGGVQ